MGLLVDEVYLYNFSLGYRSLHPERRNLFCRKAICLLTEDRCIFLETINGTLIGKEDK